MSETAAVASGRADVSQILARDGVYANGGRAVIKLVAGMHAGCVQLFAHQPFEAAPVAN